MTLVDRFQTLRQNHSKALVTFVTGGDPSLEALPDILRALERGGADAIEIGIPFSDPIADGPVIQASSDRALRHGATADALFKTLAQVKLETPIVMMGYYNSALRMGLETFAMRCGQAGASGVILSDLPADEASDWIAACEKQGLAPIFLVAPTSSDERIALSAAHAKGFVYAVARTGVTGGATDVGDEARELTRRVQQFTDLPICLGFGISKPEQARAACEFADGAIVGSAIVDLIARSWAAPDGPLQLESAVRALKTAIQF